jgi:hypothetical protein
VKRNQKFKINSPITNKLTKRQNEIIKKLNNEIEQLKRTSSTIII